VTEDKPTLPAAKYSGHQGRRGSSSATITRSGFSSSRAPAQEEDKTIILADLAVTLAPAGQRVVVLDCDPRQPREHQFFGLSNRPVVVHERLAAVRCVLARMTP
jgi:CobQ/CobB/MinD/ParA nucleotide binding domain